MKTSTAQLLANGKNNELLHAMADICGKPITISKIANVTLVCLGNEYVRLGAITPRRRCNAKSDDAYGNIEISYQDIINDDGTRSMIRIFIGVVGVGPILQADDKGWVNCYPHGNCGKNWSSGGTWYSASRGKIPASAKITDALNARHSHISEAIHDHIVDADQIRVAPILAMLDIEGDKINENTI